MTWENRWREYRNQDYKAYHIWSSLCHIDVFKVNRIFRMD